MVVFLVTILLFLVADCSSAGRMVELRIVTTSCRSSCFHYHDSKCPSSINVDGREMAPRKDGFNIVVFDTNTGKVSKRKHIRWYNNLWVGTRSEFKDFFRRIQYNSTVVMTFQNMCKSFNENWVNYLSGLTHNIKKQYYAYQAIIIACKGPCPRAAEPYTSIPYTYYSSGSRFSKFVTLLFGNAKAPPRKRRKRSGTPSNGDSIAIIGGVIGGAILVFTVLYAGYIYYNRRNEHTQVYNTRTFNPVPTDEAHESRTTTGPIYEELQLREENSKTDNPYQTLPLKDGVIYAEPSVGSIATGVHGYDVPVPVVSPPLAVVPSAPSASTLNRSGSSNSSNSYDNARTHEYEECSDLVGPSASKGCAAEVNEVNGVTAEGYEVMDGGGEDDQKGGVGDDRTTSGVGSGVGNTAV